MKMVKIKIDLGHGEHVNCWAFVKRNHDGSYSVANLHMFDRCMVLQSDHTFISW